ncbi:cupredoxin domain-containing protein [Georgenia sp. MJ170]|uniref:cupredoxin domain-containing protein n=1 Tax=Georgenia sunbinii TaxID=3117728 RepID=UPI002F25F2C0
MSQQVMSPQIHHRRPARRTLLRRIVVALLGAITGLSLVPMAASAQDQVLTWTSGNSVTDYLSAPETAVAGTAQVIFDNSVAAGNTSGMPHTLTFDTSTPGYNHDVDLNITANPYDANEGYYEAEITLTPGTYRYFCAIPGHGMMTGEFTVTDDGGGEPDPEDTTPPAVSAEVTGDQDEDGNFIGSAEVAITATDDDSGVDTIEYSLNDGEFAPYTEPITITELGDHTVNYRATDVAGNTADGTVDLTIVEDDGGEPDPEDTTPPTVTAEATGDQDEDGNFIGSAEVAITATDDDSGVDTIEYSLNDGEFTHYHAPIAISEVGDHTVDYRATDVAGNTADGSVSLTIVEEDGGDPDPGECSDTRATVIIGDVDSGVANADLGDGCTINDLIDEGGDYATHGQFVRHVGDVVRPLAGDGVISQREIGAILRAAARSEVGK